MMLEVWSCVDAWFRSLHSAFCDLIAFPSFHASQKLSKTPGGSAMATACNFIAHATICEGVDKIVRASQLGLKPKGK